MPVHVLIVDDDPGFREAARRMLADRGYDIVGEARTVAEARVAIAQRRPDALLLDINLPDGNGITLAEELLTADHRPRVLLTSSDAAAVPRRLSERCGASGFIAKADLTLADLSPYLG